MKKKEDENEVRLPPESKGVIGKITEMISEFLDDTPQQQNQKFILAIIAGFLAIMIPYLLFFN